MANNEMTAGDHVYKYDDPTHCEICSVMWLSLHCTKDQWINFQLYYSLTNEPSTPHEWREFIRYHSNKTPKELLEASKSNDILPINVASNGTSQECPECGKQMLSVCTDETPGFKTYEFYCPDDNRTTYPEIGQICPRQLVNTRWPEMSSRQKRQYIKKMGLVREAKSQ
jgi:hypothetical protein